MIKKIAGIVLSVMVFVCFSGCSLLGSDDQQGGSVKVVYLQENGEYTPYLVLSEDYGGNILLLRRDVMREMRPFSDHYAEYDGSPIDNYLSTDFQELLADNVRMKMVPSALEVASEEALYTLGRQTNIIMRSVFLLSYKEVNYSSHSMAPEEGRALPYFTSDADRVAMRDGKPCSWWLRSPYTGFDSVAWSVGGDGVKTELSCTISNGIRPAISLSGDTEFVWSSEVIEGQRVLIIE